MYDYLMALISLSTSPNHREMSLNVPMTLVEHYVWLCLQVKLCTKTWQDKNPDTNSDKSYWKHWTNHRQFYKLSMISSHNECWYPNVNERGWVGVKITTKCCRPKGRRILGKLWILTLTKVTTASSYRIIIMFNRGWQSSTICCLWRRRREVSVLPKKYS